MICMKAKCCIECNIKDDCPVHCGYGDSEAYDSLSIDNDKEFSEVFCDKCSFRVFKKES